MSKTKTPRRLTVTVAAGLALFLGGGLPAAAQSGRGGKAVQAEIQPKKSGSGVKAGGTAGLGSNIMKTKHDAAKNALNNVR